MDGAGFVATITLGQSINILAIMATGIAVLMRVNSWASKADARLLAVEAAQHEMRDELRSFRGHIIDAARKDQLISEIGRRIERLEAKVNGTRP
jgi:hypothetical protein